ncbi:hypothetical protein IGI04_010252 [Brassica rapa subsp. trilocularis]|uniref:Uncharacterized protein n=1 Tax=Brassica rapa subsp. trilocularis TaxID=1813537 RepID=A0ABQ7MZN2_BRACM|nr:hypothetical protein IGI04_010252 [Brassica rapa subsp. trilocularis]
MFRITLYQYTTGNTSTYSYMCSTIVQTFPHAMYAINLDLRYLQWIHARILLAKLNPQQITTKPAR